MGVKLQYHFGVVIGRWACVWLPNCVAYELLIVQDSKGVSWIFLFYFIESLLN